MNNLKALKLLIKYPKIVKRNGLVMAEQMEFKNRLYSEYKVKQLPTIDLLDLFPNLEIDINTYSFLPGTSLITDMVLLKSLANRFKECSYLEIGSWRGESLANVASVADNCTSLSLSSDEMRAKNLSNEFIKVHGVFSDKIDRITKIGHNSHTYEFSKLNKKFDLIFIDGDHSYKGVLNDTQKTFPLRKENKSIIVWHDYSYDSEDVRYSTLKGILDGIPKSQHKNLYHISNTMCAVYIEDINLPTTFTSFPTFQNKLFSLTLKAKKMQFEPNNK